MLYPHKSGRYKGLHISREAESRVVRTVIKPAAGDRIESASDGASSIGYVDLAFPSLEEQRKLSGRLEDLIRIEVDED